MAFSHQFKKNSCVLLQFIKEQIVWSLKLGFCLLYNQYCLTRKGSKQTNDSNLLVITKFVITKSDCNWHTFTFNLVWRRLNQKENNVANHHVWSTYLPKGDVSATPNHHLCLETNLLFILALMPARLIWSLPPIIQSISHKESAVTERVTSG